MTSEDEAKPSLKLVAETDKPAPKKESAKKKSTEPVVYTTARENDVPFKFMGCRPVRPPTRPGHFEWHVPADIEGEADKHHHVLRGRVIKVKS